MYNNILTIHSRLPTKDGFHSNDCPSCILGSEATSTRDNMYLPYRGEKRRGHGFSYGTGLSMGHPQRERDRENKGTGLFMFISCLFVYFQT